MKIIKMQHIYTAINNEGRIVGTCYFDRKFPFIHLYKKPVTGDLPTPCPAALNSFMEDLNELDSEVKRAVD